MAGQSWVALVPPGFWTVDGTALNTSTTLTKISPAPDCVVPVNGMNVGSRLRVTAAGRFSTFTSGTLNLGLYWGDVAGPALGTTGALVMPVSQTNLTWRLEAIIDFRTNGTAGTAMTTGQAILGLTTLTASSFLIPGSAPATVSIDTTVAKILALGATWSVSSASNSIQCHEWMVESLAA